MRTPSSKGGRSGSLCKASAQTCHTLPLNSPPPPFPSPQNSATAHGRHRHGDSTAGASLRLRGGGCSSSKPAGADATILGTSDRSRAPIQMGSRDGAANHRASSAEHATAATEDGVPRDTGSLRVRRSNSARRRNQMPRRIRRMCAARNRRQGRSPPQRCGARSARFGLRGKFGQRGREEDEPHGVVPALEPHSGSACRGPKSTALRRAQRL